MEAIGHGRDDGDVPTVDDQIVVAGDAVPIFAGDRQGAEIRSLSLLN
jgi:hypothetical protein